MLIEDSTELQRLFSRALKSADFHVESAATGSDAMALLQSVSPDVILLDLNLPDFSGLKIMDYVRQTSRLAHIPIIIVTANRHLYDRWENQAADLVLIKPISPTDLINMVRRFSSSTSSMSMHGS
jgi:DNA-binding response OmpR family regulator